MMNEWIISSCVLIAAVLLVRRLLRGKISLRLQYALWAVVLVRLLIPFQLFLSPFSTGAVSERVDLSAPVEQFYISANLERYEQAYDDAVRQVASQHVGVSEFVDVETIETEARHLARSSLKLDLGRLLLHIWFGGMVVIASVIAACNVHLSLQLKRRRQALDIPDCLLPVYVTEAVPTPCIFGMFRPAIYLTPEVAKDPLVRTHVLAHELTHYRHCDHIWSVLRSLCLVLHWYNPLVWIAAKVSRADAELACDEGALARLGEEARGDYGRTLISLTCPAPVSDLLLTATTMTGSAGSIRERIKLLMARPRNTVLTVTAVILMVTLIVGCTFAGAPETSAPTEPVDTTPPTAELPVSIDPATLFNAEGVLVYPGFEWFMTENEVLEALGITAQDCLEYQKTSGDGMTANGFTVKSTDAFGVPMVLNFTFRSYWLDVEPGLTEVYARFENPADFEAVRALYAQILGETDVQIAPGREEQWNGKISFKDVLHKEGYEVLQLCAAAGADVLMRPASHIIWGSGDSGWIEWRTEIPVRDTMLYQALPMVDAMAAYADKNPRKLTEKELKEFRTAFATMDENGNPNPAACFLYPYYDEIYEMDGSDFLGYFPTDQEGTKEEFELLKAKYPDFFAEWTWETMPIPIHRYSAKEIEAVVSQYGNIHWPELDEGVHYLEETGCYYNYTSDFGLGGFYAREGFVFDGGAVVYSDFSALYFTETAGNYTIRAHLPILAAE